MNPRHAVKDSIEHAPYTHLLHQRFEHIGWEKVIGTYLIGYIPSIWRRTQDLMTVTRTIISVYNSYGHFETPEKGVILKMAKVRIIFWGRRIDFRRDQSDSPYQNVHYLQPFY